MPGKYSYRSELSKRNSQVDNKARRAALRDLAVLHPEQYTVLVEGYRREMRREVFGDPDFRVTESARSKHETRDSSGRFTVTERIE